MFIYPERSDRPRGETRDIGTSLRDRTTRSKLSNNTNCIILKQRYKVTVCITSIIILYEIFI